MIEELKRAIDKVNAAELIAVGQPDVTHQDKDDADLIAKRAVIAAKHAIDEWIKAHRPATGSRPRKQEAAK